jgi:hypothetical protein
MPNGLFYVHYVIPASGLDAGVDRGIYVFSGDPKNVDGRIKLCHCSINTIEFCLTLPQGSQS